MKDLLIVVAGVYCLLCAIFVTFMFIMNLSGSGIKTGIYVDQIKECEAPLPRNQHCVLVAVPKEGETK